MFNIPSGNFPTIRLGVTSRRNEAEMMIKYIEVHHRDDKYRVAHHRDDKIYRSSP